MGRVLIIVFRILNVLLLVPFSSNMNDTTLKINNTVVVIKGNPNGTRKILSNSSETEVINT